MNRAAVRTARRAAPLGLVDLLQFHETRPPGRFSHAPGGAHLRTSPSASRIPADRLRETAPPHETRGERHSARYGHWRILCH